LFVEALGDLALDVFILLQLLAEDLLIVLRIEKLRRDIVLIK